MPQADRQTDDLDVRKAIVDPTFGLASAGEPDAGDERNAPRTMPDPKEQTIRILFIEDRPEDLERAKSVLLAEGIRFVARCETDTLHIACACE